MGVGFVGLLYSLVPRPSLTAGKAWVRGYLLYGCGISVFVNCCCGIAMVLFIAKRGKGNGLTGTGSAQLTLAHLTRHLVLRIGMGFSRVCVVRTVARNLRSD